MTSIQQLQQMQPEHPSSQSRITALLPVIKAIGPWLYALVAGTLYVSGFLVLNANLARLGILDVEFVNARYFLAGASFLFYLVCFYLFAGRAVLFMPKWLREDLERLNKDETKPVWSFVVFAHSLITATFFCCLSAALFTTIAIGGTDSATFYSVLAGAFLLQYTLDVTNLDIKYPRFTEAIQILVKSVAVYAFFRYGGSGVMLSVFISYGAIFVFTNLVLDHLTRYAITTDRLSFTGIYTAVFLLIMATSFGTLFYGQVTPKIGGIRPQAVSVGLSEDVRKALPLPFAASAGQGLDGKLVHQTSSHLYITLAGQTLRLRTSDVVALVSTTDSEKSVKQEAR